MKKYILETNVQTPIKSVTYKSNNLRKLQARAIHLATQPDVYNVHIVERKSDIIVYSSDYPVLSENEIYELNAKQTVDKLIEHLLYVHSTAKIVRVSLEDHPYIYDNCSLFSSSSRYIVIRDDYKLTVRDQHAHTDYQLIIN